MTGYSTVPTVLWHDVRDFFAALVAPCKDCMRGNPVRCWESRCAAFQFRDLARRIESAHGGVPVHVPRHVLVENEILDALHRCGIAVYPSQIVLSSTHSKANKRNAIDRLVRQGRVIEERINSYTRKISLPTTTKGNPKNEQPKPTRRGDASRIPARELGAGPTDAGDDPGAV